MDTLQPIPGTQLIVLSKHVDYWKPDGWADPFSSASIRDRQSAYVRALGLKTAFTPQFLVDGTEELQAHNNAQVVDASYKSDEPEVESAQAKMEADMFPADFEHRQEYAKLKALMGTH